MRKGITQTARNLGILVLTALSMEGHTFLVREFNMDNGLPHNRVNRIYRDSRDFLWIGTDDGLVRFDGLQFTNYSTADGLPHMHINGVLETRSGEYWIATDAGIGKFEPRPAMRRFTTFLPGNVEAARAVNTIFEDIDGSLLLGTNAGLYRFDRFHQFTAVNDALSQENPGSLKVNAIKSYADWLWLATEYRLYGRDRLGVWAQYGRSEGFFWPFVFTLTSDPSGRLWAGFRGGFGRIAVKPTLKNPILDCKNIHFRDRVY